MVHSGFEKFFAVHFYSNDLYFDPWPSTLAQKTVHNLPGPFTLAHGHFRRKNGHFGGKNGHFCGKNGHLIELKGHFNKNISKNFLNRLTILADSNILI